MSYPEAIRYIANRYHITVEEDKRELTPDEEARQKKRESALIALRIVQVYFSSCLFAEKAQAKIAHDYAAGRWTEDFCRDNGIGYAPSSRDFIAFAKSKSLDFELLEELGILRRNEKQEIYCMFSNRVTIPIRNQWSQPIAFTARTLDSNNKFKYINSPNSFLFEKGKTLFGADIARRQKGRMKCLYVVEGAPDALRLQQLGVDNVVATLGTGCTSEQFDAMMKLCDTICYIPDSEKPKNGATFSAGTTCVMTNGKEAAKRGFKVMVREIPLPEGEDKADADSYFQTPEMIEALPAEDFAIWYCKKAMEHANTPTETAAAMKDVCGILAGYDNTTAAVILSQLGKTKEKKAWQAAYKAAVNEKTLGNATGQWQLAQTRSL